MRDHVAAIESLLTDDLPCHWVEAPSGAVLPYRLLWQSTGRPLDEAALCGRNEAFTALVGLTSVGATPEAAREKASKAKALLFPGGYPADLAVTGRVADIRWEAFSAAYVDRDLPLPVTNYPSVYIDLYLLTSVPA